MKSYDAVVIGGGPAGLTAALYLLRAGVNMALCEKLSPGGQVLMTETIDNYPGHPKGIKGYELADLFAAHLDGYSPDRYADEIRSVTRQEDGRFLLEIGGETIQSRAVLACSGARYRRMGVPGEEKFIGRGVSYCALCDGNFFRDQTVAVVGGGNSALEESLYLARLVKKLYLIHRRDEFRGHRCYQDKCLAHPKIQPVLSTVVREIVGETGVQGLMVENLKTKEVQRLDVDGVFVFVGFEPVGDFLPQGLERDPSGFVLTDCEMRTNVPGFFAAGDIRSKACRQVVTAAGDGATAATSAYAYLEHLHG